MTKYVYIHLLPSVPDIILSHPYATAALLVFVAFGIGVGVGIWVGIEIFSAIEDMHLRNAQKPAER